MRDLWSFVKTTLLGGLLLLLPLAMTLVIVVKAAEIAVKAVSPLADMLPYPKAEAIVIVYVGGIVVLALLSFIAGMFARALSAGRLVAWLEDHILMRFPPYAVIRNISQNLAGIEDDHGMKPVLVRGDAGWRIGIEVEPAAAGFATIFLPDAPNTALGVVRIVATDRLTAIDASVHDVLARLKKSGKGLRDLVQVPAKAALDIPAGQVKSKSNQKIT